jgi:hypothetical protein
MQDCSITLMATATGLRSAADLEIEQHRVTPASETAMLGCIGSSSTMMAVWTKDCVTVQWHIVMTVQQPQNFKGVT